jgi:predicted PurR-regulated permease PerM
VNKWLAVALLAFSGWLLYLLAPVLTPFVAGALLAYLGDPLADRLEARGLSRLPAVIIVFAVMITAVVLLLFLVVPVLVEQVSNLIGALPAYARTFQNMAGPWVQKHFGVRPRFSDLDQLAGMLSTHWQQAGGLASGVFESLTHSGAVVLSWVLNLVLIPVVMFYLLRDWDQLVTRLHDLLPRRWAGTVSNLAGEADEVLSAVFRGQLMVMIALAGIYSAGLWLVGLNLGLLIGMLSGLLSFIPYVGSLTGILVASFTALAQFGEVNAVLWVLAVFGVGQAVESMFLTPNLIGQRIGLHPVAVIFAVLAGGQLFGFLGVMLALPLASVVMVLVRHAHDLYKDSDLYGVAGGNEALSDE